MAIQVQIPALGESIKQAVLLKWHKAEGEAVKADEPLCELETDKANVDVPSPGAGVLHRAKGEGQTVNVGEVIATIDPAGTAPPAPTPAAKPAGSTAAPPPTQPAARPEDLAPSVRRLAAESKVEPSQIKGSGKGGRVTKEDVLRQGGTEVKPSPQPSPGVPGEGVTGETPVLRERFDADGIYREPMSNIRKRIAERLLVAQQTAAILTTFNEVDMTAILDLRARHKERFQEVHGIGLGLMSFFVRGTVLALAEFPRINAFIEDDHVVYHKFVHMGIAVSTERGLTVPVLRDAQMRSFAQIEREIKRLAEATRAGKLSLDDLTGGTFTITNGGVFGSLLSTPILNPPQSGILGMHTIQKRPMAVGDKVEIRPMMYIALSYDHRLVDGRESVSFLVRLKQYLEDPARLMLEI